MNSFSPDPTSISSLETPLPSPSSSVLFLYIFDTLFHKSLHKLFSSSGSLPLLICHVPIFFCNINVFRSEGCQRGPPENTKLLRQKHKSLLVSVLHWLAVIRLSSNEETRPNAALLSHVSLRTGLIFPNEYQTENIVYRPLIISLACLSLLRFTGTILHYISAA